MNENYIRVNQGGRLSKMLLNEFVYLFIICHKRAVVPSGIEAKCRKCYPGN